MGRATPVETRVPKIPARTGNARNPMPASPVFDAPIASPHRAAMNHCQGVRCNVVNNSPIMQTSLPKLDRVTS